MFSFYFIYSGEILEHYSLVMVSTHLCMLVWPCIKILFVPHIGWGGADNICWDPQLGGVSEY